MSGGPPRGSYSNAGRGSYDNGRSNGPNYSDGGAGGRGGRPAMNSQANSGNNYDNRGQYGGGNRNNQEYWPQDQGPRQDNQRYNDQSYQQNGPPQQYGNSGRSYNSGRPPRDQQNGPQQNFQDRYRGDNQEYNDRSSRNYDRQPPSNQHRGGYSQGPQQNQRGGYNDNCQRQPQNFQNQRGDQDHRQSSNYQQDRAPRGMGRPNQYNNGPNQDNYQYGNGPNQQQYRNADNDYRQRNQGNDRRYEEGPTFGGPQQPYYGNDDSSNNFQQSRGLERSTRGGYSGPGGRGGSTFGGNSGRGGASFGGRGGSNCGSRDDYRSGGYSNASSGYNNGGGGGSRYESRFESRLASRDGNSRGGGDDSRAPVNFRPEIRAVDDIFREDAELAQRDGSRLDEDADVDIEETNEKLITEQWSEMDLHPKVCENIMKSGYIRPRKVQQFTIPYVLSGYDCKVQCETGSGKTAAFCVPIISNLAKGFDDGSIHSIPDSPLALVIAPTRELASQLYDQAKKFAVGTKVSVAVAYGQYALRQNIADLKAGCHVVCATLGRLLQLIKEERIRLNELKYLVIDEADRLLVENSREELMELINFPTMPKERQTLLFSATLEDYAVTNFARNYMNCNLMVKITANAKSNRRLKYEIYAVRDDRAKHQAILAYLKKISPGNNIPRVLIFVNKKIDTDRVATSLTVKGYGATTIHGDRGQHLREEAMRSFRSGKTKILVATDVCARGVDIHDLDYVVNFDIPNGDSTFVQRCGRTGRTHEGVAASFYLEYSDRSYAETIAMVMEAAGQNPPEFLRSGVHEEDFKLLEEEHEQDEQSGNPQPPAAPTENVREEDSGWD